MKAIANAKVMHDNSACMKALMDGTNLILTGNPNVKTVKTLRLITRYTLRYKTTYLLIRPPYVT